MPDTTEKLEAARKLVGTYWKVIHNGHVFRIVGIQRAHDFSVLSIQYNFNGLTCTTEPWVHGDSGPACCIQISRAEYLSVAAPLFAELAEMAGISEGKE